jgi:hypothetical protein
MEFVLYVVFRTDEMGGACSTIWERRNAYWWESQRERDQKDDPRRRCKHKIKTDLAKKGWGSVDWIDLAQVETSGELL